AGCPRPSRPRRQPPELALVERSRGRVVALLAAEIPERQPALGEVGGRRSRAREEGGGAIERSPGVTVLAAFGEHAPERGEGTADGGGARAQPFRSDRGGALVELGCREVIAPVGLS